MPDTEMGRSDLSRAVAVLDSFMDGRPGELPAGPVPFAITSLWEAEHHSRINLGGGVDDLDLSWRGG